MQDHTVQHTVQHVLALERMNLQTLVVSSPVDHTLVPESAAEQGRNAVRTSLQGLVDGDSGREYPHERTCAQCAA